MSQKPRIVDLFCGAGGLSRGFEDAGFQVVASVDIEKRFKETFNRNHISSVFNVADLSEGIPEAIKAHKVDLVIGSPPCQGFSDARGCREAINEEQKIRNNLPFDFIKVVEHIQPKIALMENVSGMGTFKIKDRLLVDVLVEKFNEIGYNVIFEQLNSAHYGVPQERIRVLGLAIKNEFKIDPVLIKCDIEGKYKEKQSFLTVRDAFYGLPTPTETGECTFMASGSTTTLPPYIMKLREHCKDDYLFNHKVVEKTNAKEKEILPELGEGKIYRSSRFGDRYVGVWQLFKHDFKDDEIQLLHFLCRKRTNNEFKEEQESWKEGYIRPTNFPTDKDGRFFWNEEYDMKASAANRAPRAILDDLYERKWLRKKEYNRNGKKFVAFDINTKSGIRPLYLRLSRFEPSRTIMTTSFRARELVHPTDDRAISLREGARIQSFPDDFVFYGNDRNDITTMIGNAVPPLMGRELARYIKTILAIIEDNTIREETKFLKAIAQTRKPINTINVNNNRKMISLLDFV